MDYLISQSKRLMSLVENDLLKFIKNLPKHIDGEIDGVFVDFNSKSIKYSLDVDIGKYQDKKIIRYEDVKFNLVSFISLNGRVLTYLSDKDILTIVDRWKKHFTEILNDKQINSIGKDKKIEFIIREY